jgi:hypothetical protein
MYPGLRPESTSQALSIVPRENTSRLSLGISGVPRKNISQSSTPLGLFRVPRKRISQLPTPIGIFRVLRKIISQPPTYLGSPGLILMVSSLWIAGKIQGSRKGQVADLCVVSSPILPLVRHQLTEHLAGTTAARR